MTSIEIATKDEWLRKGFKVKPNENPIMIKDTPHYSERQVVPINACKC
jgi:hypothetical protein